MVSYRLYIKNEVYAKIVERATKEGKTVGRWLNDVIEKAVGVGHESRKSNRKGSD